MIELTAKELGDLDMKHIAEVQSDLREGDVFTCQLTEEDWIPMLAKLNALKIKIIKETQ